MSNNEGSTVCNMNARGIATSLKILRKATFGGSTKTPYRDGGADKPFEPIGWSSGQG